STHRAIVGSNRESHNHLERKGLAHRRQHRLSGYRDHQPKARALDSASTAPATLPGDLQMTLSTAGLPGEVTSPQWSRLIDIVGNHVTTGVNVDPASGDRTVSVSSGLSNVGGMLYMSDATETVELPENSSNRSRIDRIILRADWSTPRGYITYRRGTASSAPIPPALTREPGVQYEVPIAEVTVGPGQGSLTASDVVR